MPFFSAIKKKPAQVFPPGPKSLIPGGTVLAFRRDPIGFLMSTVREFGDIAHFGVGSKHFFVVNHPEYIKDILTTHNSYFRRGRALTRARGLLGNGLLTSEGEFHQRQRRLAQPAFHRDRIARYTDSMVACADRMQRERWREGQALDMAQEMFLLTLVIVVKALFNTETEAEAEQIRRAICDNMKGYGKSILPFARILRRLPLPKNRRSRKAREFIDSLIYRMIKERRQSGVDRGDFLSVLLAAQDEEGDGGQMTDMQVRDEAHTIILTGHEASAIDLTWTWYLLSQHPEVEARLHDELDTVLRGRLPAADDFTRLRFTEMVIKESMRLCPPVWGEAGER